MNPDLVTITLTLHPLEQPDPTAPLPLWWGRAAHALLLDVVRRADPALATALHPPAGRDEPTEDGDSTSAQHTQSSVQPFTVSNLLGRFPNGTLDATQTYTLHLSGLRADLSAILLQAAQDGPLSPGARIELDYRPFSVESPLRDTHSVVAQADSPLPGTGERMGVRENTYQELIATYLLASQAPPRKLSLRLFSPTTFKSGGKHLPVPLPELVFGSLLDKWNCFAPIRFPPETKRYAAECLAIERYDLSTRAVQLKGGGLRVGAVGSATYVTLNYDRYWMSLISTLAAFSAYAGVGAACSLGLGQCQPFQQESASKQSPGELSESVSFSSQRRGRR